MDIIDVFTVYGLNIFSLRTLGHVFRPSSYQTGLLVIVMKLKAKENIQIPAISVFYMLREC
jgi:hypothetical protein